MPALAPLEVVPTAESFDVVIIGGGPGGYATALYGASAGLRIALIEKGKMGGTCLNVGCIPAKELLETAAVFRMVNEAAEFGIGTSAPTVDFSVTQIRKQKVVDQLVGGLTTLLKRRKVTIYDGYGTLGPGHVVKVTGGESGDVELIGDAVVLATGSVPRTIPGFEVDGEIVLTSDEMLSLQPLPPTAAVIGGGAIGCEFASMMADLGTKVTILEALPKILPGCDDDVTKLVLRQFKKRGIDVRTGVAVTGHEPAREGRHHHQLRRRRDPRGRPGVHVGRPSALHRGRAGRGHRGGGRRPGLHRGRRRVPHRASPASTRSATSSPRRRWPTSGSSRASRVVKDILGEDPVGVDYANVPWCIYCYPEVAFAGHSRAVGRGRRPRRGRVGPPLHRQRPRPHPRRARRHGEDHRRETF